MQKKINNDDGTHNDDHHGAGVYGGVHYGGVHSGAHYDGDDDHGYVHANVLHDDGQYVVSYGGNGDDDQKMARKLGAWHVVLYAPSEAHHSENVQHWNSKRFAF